MKLLDAVTELAEANGISEIYFFDRISKREQLEYLRCEIISIGLRIKDAITFKETVSEKIKYNQEYIDALNPVREKRIKALQKTLIHYQEEYTRLHPLYRHKREALQERIHLTKHEMSIQQENTKYAADASAEIRNLSIKVDNLKTEIQKLTILKDVKTDEYKSLKLSVSAYDIDTIVEERLKIRPHIEAQYDDGKKYKFSRAAETFDRTYDNMQPDIEQLKMKIDF